MRFIIFLILLFTIACPVQAKYAPKVNITDEQVADVKKGIYAMKMLPRLAREACIAEKLGLLFTPDGKPAYSKSESFSKIENVRYFQVYDSARFVSSEGRLYGFYEVVGTKVRPNPKVLSMWYRAKQAIYNYGEEALFSAFKDDVTRIVLATAKNRLSMMPGDLRDACFAQYTGWCYTQDGNSAVRIWHYVSKSSANLCEGTHRQAIWNELHNNAIFTSSNNVELSFSKLYKERGKYSQSWGIVGLCVDLVGIRDIMSLFPKERDIMKAGYEKQTGMSAPPLN